VLIAWRRHAQLLVLLLLRDCLPLVVGQHLALLLGPALADHQIGRQYDGFERHDHGEAVRSGRARPGSRSRRQPDDVDADEPHRAGESRDLICDPVLHALPALLVCCSSAGLALLGSGLALTLPPSFGACFVRRWLAASRGSIAIVWASRCRRVGRLQPSPARSYASFEQLGQALLGPSANSARSKPIPASAQR
jgi:hypothetical protein